jgi:predicted dehydrogenase
MTPLSPPISRAGWREHSKNMIRIGIVGLDSTHAVEFSRLLKSDFAGRAQVTAVCPGAPTNFPLSERRRAQITREVLAEPEIQAFPDIAALVEAVDAIMVLSCDGRKHAAEARELFSAGKPVFIDKPLSADCREAAQILQRAETAGVPCFSASALRYRESPPTNSPVSRIEVTVPRRAEPGHPELLWHGIHGIEAAFALLGPGCETVRREVSHGSDLTYGRWTNGSEALIIREDSEAANRFAARVFTPSGQTSAEGHSYLPLLATVVQFFATRQAPLTTQEMLEPIAFAAAADLSRERHGASVRISDLLALSTTTRPV